MSFMATTPKQPAMSMVTTIAHTVMAVIFVFIDLMARSFCRASIAHSH
jgi:hypothetical protein